MPVAGQSIASSQINVLIADDNVTNRKLLRTVLEYAGHTVLEADNGVTALKFLEQGQVARLDRLRRGDRRLVVGARAILVVRPEPAVMCSGSGPSASSTRVGLSRNTRW